MDDPKFNTDHSSFFEHIGYVKHKSEKGNVILELPMNQDLTADDGTVPVGVFASMLDIVVGSTIASVVGHPNTTVNLNFSFFDLTNKGPFASYASIIHRDGKMITGEGYILDKDENLVAKGIGTFKIISA